MVGFPIDDDDAVDGDAIVHDDVDDAGDDHYHHRGRSQNDRNVTTKHDQKYLL